MKTILAVLFVIMLHNSAFSQSMERETQIRNLERHWTNLLDNRDTTALRAIFTKDYVVNNAAGKIVTVDDIFSLLKSGHVFPKVDRDIQKITFNGVLAVVMGGEIEHGDHGEKKSRRFTNIWIQTKDGWKLVARQATGG